MSEDLRISPDQIIERYLSMELVRVTERAAVSAARWRGHGNEKAADQAAVDAMRRELNRLPIDGEIVIGEGERDEAPMLYIGEKVGTGEGPKIDIALDPLEGTTICAKGGPNAISCIAMAPHGGFLNAPDVYMDKIAVGGGLPEGVIRLMDPPHVNLGRLAEAKGVSIRQYDVIYRVTEDIEKALNGLLGPEYKTVVLGRAEVRAVFKIGKLGNVAGCSVREGELRRNAKMRVLRQNKVEFDGEIASLKHEKDDVREVQKGHECGVALKDFDAFRVGDILECYVVERVN